MTASVLSALAPFQAWKLLPDAFTAPNALQPTTEQLVKTELMS